MYQQMRQDILARIRRGEFKPGDRLPSENQVCEEYSVSVTTARRAFLELVKEGVVQRRAGVGTIVAPHVRRVRLAFVSVGYLGESMRRISSAMGELIAGIGERAWQEDASFSMVGVHNDEAATYLRGLVRERSADGVLLRNADNIEAELLQILDQAGLPYVAIKRHIPGQQINCVISDDVSGGQLATAHLLEQGHRRIGFVCAKPYLTMSRQRRTGYTRALLAHGILPDDTLVREEADFTPELGYQAVHALLQLPERPTAIFVASDTMALGGYEVARELELTVPDDVAFVGYDDIQPVAMLRPPLTTVRTSHYDFGQLSADLLIELITGRAFPPQQRVLKPVLIVRDSSQPHPLAAAPLSPAVPLLADAAATTPGGYAAHRPQLTGKVVVTTGDAARLSAALEQACAAAGARVVTSPSPPGIALDGQHDLTVALTRAAAAQGTLDIVFYTLDLSRDLSAGLSHLATAGQCAARWLAQQDTGGALIVVATAAPTGAGFDEVAHVAARAGLANVTQALAGAWSTRQVRVNAVLAIADLRANGQEMSHASITEPALFLASPGATAIAGETLLVRANGHAPGLANGARRALLNAMNDSIDKSDSDKV